MRTSLRDLDDRVLGTRRAPEEEVEPYPDERRDELPPPRRGDAAQSVLAAVVAVSRLVFLALALAVALGIVFVLAPTNPDNAIVENTLGVAEWAAGPFADIFDADSAETELVVNYAVAVGLFLLAAALVTRIPTSRR